MERGAEIFAALTYFALGLSHVVQPRAWAELFLLLKSQGKVGAFLDGFINLLLGAIVVSFHNVWHGLAMVVTIVGWGQVVKGLRIMVLRRSTCTKSNVGSRSNAPGCSGRPVRCLLR